MLQFAPLQNDAKLPVILDYLFSIIEKSIVEKKSSVEWKIEDSIEIPNLLCTLLLSYIQLSPIQISSNLKFQKPNIATFNGFEIIQLEKIKEIETYLQSLPRYNSKLNMAITYLLDELVCNIQQHSQCTQCLISADLNENYGSVDICISDNGISLYGSYVKSGRYSNKLGQDSISALCMAKDGFSTKNRPDAENRGYGISSNLKMVIKGLSGDFSIISGNALYLNTAGKQQLIGLPETIEWQGTTIIVRIPINPPTNFNIYDYIS